MSCQQSDLGWYLRICVCGDCYMIHHWYITTVLKSAIVAWMVVESFITKANKCLQYIATNKEGFYITVFVDPYDSSP